MKKDHLLSEADVRAMVRLIGENCAVKGDINDKRRHLMTGLCQLIGGDTWCWAMAAEMNPNRLPVYIGFIQGGFSEDAFARYLKAQTHPDMIWATSSLCRELERKKKHLTRTAQQVVSFPKFLEAPVSKLWRDSGVYPGLISFCPLPDGIFSGVAIYRKCDRDLFNERERRIAHIILTEVPWLHVNQSSETTLTHVPELPVRQRLALELLLQGRSRKAIANDMDISINTVAGYVRDLYRFFNVTSQAQLVRRFFRGDGGDVK